MARKKKKNPDAVARGRMGGLVKSARKTKAVRKNGLLGGRPYHCRGGRPFGSKNRPKVPAVVGTYTIHMEAISAAKKAAEHALILVSAALKAAEASQKPAA